MCYIYMYVALQKTATKDLHEYFLRIQVHFLLQSLFLLKLKTMTLVKILPTYIDIIFKNTLVVNKVAAKN